MDDAWRARRGPSGDRDDGQPGRVVSVWMTGEDDVDLVRLVVVDDMADDRFTRLLGSPVDHDDALIIPRASEVPPPDRDRVASALPGPHREEADLVPHGCPPLQ